MSITNSFAIGITKQISTAALENTDSLKKIIHSEHQNTAVMGTLSVMHKCLIYYIPYLRRGLHFTQTTFINMFGAYCDHQ
jgi:hypothetical protein